MLTIGGLQGTPPRPRYTFTFSADTADVNIATLLGLTGVKSADIELTIPAGITVYSSSPTGRAMGTGSLGADCNIIINISGTLTGAGGAGGGGAPSGGGAGGGQAGGDAFQKDVECNVRIIVNSGGRFQSGGGGGGGGGYV